MHGKRIKLLVHFLSKLFRIVTVKRAGKIKTIEERIGKLKIVVINIG